MSGAFKANAMFCANCFCFVCDIPSSECKDWESHAQATHTASMWRDKRAAAKAALKAAEVASASSASAGGAAPSASAAPVTRWSCDKLLKVRAVEPEP